jgi:hypothetical protein
MPIAQLRKINRYRIGIPFTRADLLAMESRGKLKNSNRQRLSKIRLCCCVGFDIKGYSLTLS